MLVDEFLHQRDQPWISPGHRKQHLLLRRKVEADLVPVLLVHFQLPGVQIRHVFLDCPLDSNAQRQGMLMLS
jgi:hypothetical protein